jgi:3-mercaptopyruvate sulfurtransferase SseA
VTHDLISLLGQYGLAVVFANAAQVAKILMNSGFTKVRPLHGGLEAWIAAGYEVETLACRGADRDGVRGPGISKMERKA